MKLCSVFVCVEWGGGGGGLIRSDKKTVHVIEIFDKEIEELCHI